MDEMKKQDQDFEKVSPVLEIIYILVKDLRRYLRIYAEDVNAVQVEEVRRVEAKLGELVRMLEDIYGLIPPAPGKGGPQLPKVPKAKRDVNVSDNVVASASRSDEQKRRSGQPAIVIKGVSSGSSSKSSSDNSADHISSNKLTQDTEAKEQGGTHLEDKATVEQALQMFDELEKKLKADSANEKGTVPTDTEGSSGQEVGGDDTKQTPDTYKGTDTHNTVTSDSPSGVLTVEGLGNATGGQMAEEQADSTQAQGDNVSIQTNSTNSSGVGLSNDSLTQAPDTQSISSQASDNLSSQTVEQSHPGGGVSDNVATGATGATNAVDGTNGNGQSDTGNTSTANSVGDTIGSTANDTGSTAGNVGKTVDNTDNTVNNTGTTADKTGATVNNNTAATTNNTGDSTNKPSATTDKPGDADEELQAVLRQLRELQNQDNNL